MWEMWVESLGWEDPLEKEMVTASSIFAWEIPWTEELADYSPRVIRVRYDAETTPPPQEPTEPALLLQHRGTLGKSLNLFDSQCPCVCHEDKHSSYHLGL